ncbi:sulfurtransferase FdhD [Rhodoferax saidenbachensis]|uniref:Sulfur carrier protein FdhD n=2 Tax=Rhodoferax saidenbachensis TaxID=1484693 RepID=A0A1P8KCR7_9BURK|nr:sulfurtransferase FdhD [Rhodoferax saidenbachensis]
MPEFEDHLPSPLADRAVQRMPFDGVLTDTVAAEVPVALVFNGISHAVMMATPQDLEAFALGFALSEGILDTPQDCFGIEVHTTTVAAVQSVEVHLDIAARCFARLKERRRSLAGATGCGLCGVDSLQALDLAVPPMPQHAWVTQLQAATVLRALQAMPALQVLNARCGSLHAAGWASPEGELLQVMEDVGRHNALDKLLGARAQAGLLGEAGFIVMSSRASYELVRKCARLQVRALATISAPTDLAISIARGAGLQLWGLCRDPRAVLYTSLSTS